MWVGASRFDLRLRDSHSLKEKRAVLRSLISVLHQRFDCAVAEVDYQDVHQRAAVGVSIVAGERFHAEKVLREIGRHVESHPGAELLDQTIDLWRPGD